MKKISIVSFTRNGTELCYRAASELKLLGYDISAFAMEEHIQEMKANAYEVKAYEAKAYEAKAFEAETFEAKPNEAKAALEVEIKPLKEKLREWTKLQFQSADAIIYIGAAGIAVRAIAAFIHSKTTDPAVLVIDEQANFAIPLLSGHIGGANELAGQLALKLHCVPVITTATDLNGLFAVDVFAVKNNLFIANMEYAKKISAAVLKHEKIGITSDFELKGTLPDYITPAIEQDYGICITLDERSKPFPKTLNLIPRIITLGIGCKKGKSLEEIEELVLEVLELQNISIHAVRNVATIDLKKEEQGLLEFCEKYKLELNIYSSTQLEEVSGNFTESEYVKKITGIGNVCERAAILGSSNGKMIQEKTAKNGVTVSITRREQVIYFE
jgi:cobalt-precorrin 5A hydrolase